MIVFMQVRLITDQKERQKILLSCHRHPTSGHLGVRRTLSRITEKVYVDGSDKRRHENGMDMSACGCYVHYVRSPALVT